MFVIYKTGIVCFILGLVGFVGFCSVVVALQIRFLLWIYSESYIQQLKTKLNYATTISEYAAVGVELDRRLGLDTWKKDIRSHSYDFHRVQLWQKSLAIYLTSNSFERICETMLQAQKVNHGGAFSPDIYCYTFWNTKDAILDYHKLIIQTIDYLTECAMSIDKPGMKMVNMISQMTHTWGRCALFLEGSRSAMFYHYGVCKGLLHTHCIPQIIYAKESNALLGAWFSLNADILSPSDVIREEEILNAIKLLRRPCEWYNLSLRHRRRILNQLSCLYGDISMLEAYNLSGRQLNLICRRGDHFYVMNYKTTPDVSITSSVLACMCNDVLQPTGGPLYPVLHADTPTGDMKNNLWGLTVKEERFTTSLVLPESQRVGQPLSESLTRTAGRELIIVSLSMQQILKSLIKQLMGLLYNQPKKTDITNGVEPGCYHRSHSALTGAIRFIKIGAEQREISNLVTNPKTQIRLAPKARPWHSTAKQIANGLSTAFANACLMKVRLDLEKSIDNLADAISHSESTAC